MAEIALTVNGEEQRVAVFDRDEPLLYVLRESLGLTGARFGCGQGLCGACAVLVDGRLSRSCDLPLWSVENREIITPEASDAASPLLAAVRAALTAEGAGQCGYCLSGMVIAITALLHVTRSPDRTAINAALARQLCRCGAHPRIIRAIRRLVADRVAT